MEKAEEVELLIVGAGLHGLAMAKTYLEVHPSADMLVIDQARSLGGSWAEERLYPGLKTNNVVGTYEFGDFPMTLDKYGLAPGSHIPGSVVHQYLSDFASYYKLDRLIRYETAAISATLQVDNRWLVQMRHKSEAPRDVIATRLVMATGLTSQPNIPTFAGQKDFDGAVFHAKELLDRSKYIESKKSIVVIGGNKSAWDACYHAARLGIQVHMLIRPSGGGPSYLWPKRFQWGPFNFSLANFSSTRMFAVLDPSPFGRSVLSGWVRDIVHQTSVGQWLSQLFWNGLDRHIKRLHGFRNSPELANIEPWTTPFWMGNSLGIHNYESNWFDLVREGKIVVHSATISQLLRDDAILSDGARVKAEAVVCCTGWKLEPSVIFEPRDASGLLRKEKSYNVAINNEVTAALQYIETKIPYLATLTRRTSIAPKTIGDVQKTGGSRYQLYRYTVPWQRRYMEARCIAYIGMQSAINNAVVAQVQALWITAFFDDRISHLRKGSIDFDAVRYDAILHTVYQRLRRPEEAGGIAGKYGDFVFDSLTFVDMMLKDLGLKRWRKESWWKELFEPYRPRHYRGLVSELIVASSCE